MEMACPWLSSIRIHYHPRIRHDPGKRHPIPWRVSSRSHRYHPCTCSYSLRTIWSCLPNELHFLLQYARRYSVRVRCNILAGILYWQFYRWVLAAASVLLCAIAGIRQLYLSQWSHVSLSDQLDGRATGRSSPLSVYMKKWLFMPALFGKRSSERPAFWGFTLSIPTRLQSLLLFFYLLVNGVALGVRYFTFLDNIYWPGDIPAQLTRYVADRSGVLSFA